jgi:RNA polymerase sigma factor (sigma-70 family)
MKKKATDSAMLLPTLFRREYASMVAVLCRHFGLKQMEIAEDIVSDTFLKATEVWGSQFIPENPTAWLYTVAKNKTKDYLKSHSVHEKKINGVLEYETVAQEKDFDFNQKSISDSQLAMIFAVCNSTNATESQICLALQVLCGFSVEEIANAFLTNRETIKKRLHRAKATMREDNFQIKGPIVQANLDAVLRTIYLLFNEGYFSKTSSHFIRKGFCSEAIRLALLLLENQSTNRPDVNALMALMCFQSSRLEARADDFGETILFDEQDQNLWNKDLIDKGNYYLVNACTGNDISKYHLEAGIAYWHTAETKENKWEHILHLYNQLVIIEYTPPTALNRTFAFAQVYGNEQAIQEAEKLTLEKVPEYHALLGYLYASSDPGKARIHYSKAIDLTKSMSERKTLTKELQRLS